MVRVSLMFLFILTLFSFFLLSSLFFSISILPVAIYHTNTLTLNSLSRSFSDHFIFCIPFQMVGFLYFSYLFSYRNFFLFLLTLCSNFTSVADPLPRISNQQTKNGGKILSDLFIWDFVVVAFSLSHSTLLVQFAMRIIILACVRFPFLFPHPFIIQSIFNNMRLNLLCFSLRKCAYGIFPSSWLFFFPSF